jgi:hypothetical protein
VDGDFATSLACFHQNRRACPQWAGLSFFDLAALLSRVVRLEAVGDSRIPLDQAADLLDHQVGVSREHVQYILECFIGLSIFPNVSKQV